MNVNAAVAVVLFFMLLLLVFCIWASYWEWMERDEKFWQGERDEKFWHERRRRNRQQAMYHRESQGGASFIRGSPYDVYQAYGVQP